MLTIRAVSLLLTIQSIIYMLNTSTLSITSFMNMLNKEKSNSSIF